jgi:predicted  nucleic acid-binding Zn-ribbon protein
VAEFNDLQLDMRELKILLIERKEQLEKHTNDIDKAFESIHAINDVVIALSGTVAKLEEYIQTSRDAEKATEGRLRVLEKGFNRMSWIITIATMVVSAAIVKYFVG